jgi:SOS-response transcriptional repressor LexA/transcriptional regulator with XRE-family HTH domain
MGKTTKSGKPEWAVRITALRRYAALTQSQLGSQLNCSAMAISRWERGEQEPPANIYIQLGNITGDPECWYFWARAGLHSVDLMRVLPAAYSRLRRDPLPGLQVIHAGAHRIKKGANGLVAIPVLPITAATHGGKGDPELAFDQVRPEGMLAAPSLWCPNPAYTSCLRVRGRSMMPVLHDGYIIAVDTSQTNRRKLYGEIVVAAHNDQGLIVSRLQRYEDAEVLVPENREYESIPISTPDWRIKARILWWIGRAQNVSGSSKE